MRTSAPVAASAAIPMRGARIDWTKGRVIGFSVADRNSEAFEVVQLHLDGQCVVSGVANRSVFELAKDLAGLDLPAREHSAFELQIPARGLHSGMSSDSVVHLEVKTAQGELIFDYYLAGLRDLLRLTDVPPTDLLYDVRFRGLCEGRGYPVARIGVTDSRDTFELQDVFTAILDELRDVHRPPLTSRCGATVGA